MPFNGANAKVRVEMQLPWAFTGVRMLLITLINAAQMRQRAPAAGQAARLLHQNTPPKNRMRCRAFSLGITGHHWGPLGTAGIAGMHKAPPAPFFSSGPAPSLGV